MISPPRLPRLSRHGPPLTILKQMFPYGPWIVLYESPDHAAMRRQYGQARRALKSGQSVALMQDERLLERHAHNPTTMKETA